jgi:hypothetical protein
MEPKIFEVVVDSDVSSGERMTRIATSVYKGADQDEASDAYVGYTSDPAYASAHISMWEDGELVDERQANETDFSDVE